MSLLWKTKQSKCVALKALAFQCTYTSDYDACEQLTFHTKVFTYLQHCIVCVLALKATEVCHFCFFLF